MVDPTLRRLAAAALTGALLATLPMAPSPLAQEAARSAAEPGESTEQRRRLAEERQDEAQRRAAEARRKAAEARRKANVARRDAEQLRRDEADMLARARAEAEERTAERRMREAEVERADAERAAVAARNEREALQHNLTPAEREAAEDRLIEAARAADAARRAMEEARADEISRIADKLRAAQERRAAAGRPTGLPPPDPERASAPEPEPVPASPSPHDRAPPREAPASEPRNVVVVEPPPAPGTVPLLRAPETRVSVLILMQPGDRGIRRVNKTADPVLCIGEHCYISRGSDRDAKRVSRLQALGMANTLGNRAGACREQLGCVFRNIDLGSERARLQPVDLRLVRHDRREARETGADASCAVIAGRLSCAAGIQAHDYRLWLVPESIAVEAGAGALEAALRAGLPDGRRVEARP